MKHIRIPVTTGHYEAGWFGYLYVWQGQPNGAVGTRLEMNDPREFPSQGMRWEDPIGVDALGGPLVMPLEEDSWGIMADHYPDLRRRGGVEYKQGVKWVAKV